MGCPNWKDQKINLFKIFETIDSPIAKEAVAAGLGELRTCNEFSPSSKRKSSTKFPSLSTACALTPDGICFISLRSTPLINF